MSDVERWDLDRVLATPVSGRPLTERYLRELLPPKKAIDSGNLFPHIMPADVLARGHSNPASHDPKSRASGANRDLGYQRLVARLQSLAGRGSDLRLGMFDREGTTYRRDVPDVQPDGSWKYKTDPSGGLDLIQLRYPLKAEDHVFIDGAVETLVDAQQRGLNVLVTGQSGVGRGYFSEEALFAEMADVVRAARSRGVLWDLVVYCPHKEGLKDPHLRPDEEPSTPYPYGIGCGARKGHGYGMYAEVFGLLRMLGIDINPENAFAVGDKKDDMVTADLFNRAWAERHAGVLPIKSHLVSTGYAGGSNDRDVLAIQEACVYPPVVIGSIEDLPMRGRVGKYES